MWLTLTCGHPMYPIEKTSSAPIMMPHLPKYCTSATHIVRRLSLLARVAVSCRCLPTRRSSDLFMFATGIENSYPTIVLPDGTTKRVDEMEKTCHYKHWEADFLLLKEVGIDFLRYGPPYFRVHTAPRSEERRVGKE